MTDSRIYVNARKDSGIELRQEIKKSLEVLIDLSESVFIVEGYIPIPKDLSEKMFLAKSRNPDSFEVDVVQWLAQYHWYLSSVSGNSGQFPVLVATKK